MQRNKDCSSHVERDGQSSVGSLKHEGWSRLREQLENPAFIKLVDQITYTLGFVCFFVTQTIIQVRPELLGPWICILVPPLTIVRFWIYRQKKMHYFMIDWCYVNNTMVVLHILVFNDSALYFQVCTGAEARLYQLRIDSFLVFQVLFWLSNGPLAPAIIMWRNSLVFHSLDKITSIAIHILPTLYTLCFRWLVNVPQHHICTREDCSVYMSDMWLPLLLHTIWQFSHIYKTEVIDKEKLAADVEIQSSIRWFTRSRSGFFYWVCLRLMR